MRKRATLSVDGSGKGNRVFRIINCYDWYVLELWNHQKSILVQRFSLLEFSI
jgi:hypothetical protein